MTPEKLFHELLGLGLNWAVFESPFEQKRGTVLWELRETAWLWRRLFRPVDAACAQADLSNVCCVGADAMSVRKGHEYGSVFADLVHQRVRWELAPMQIR